MPDPQQPAPEQQMSPPPQQPAQQPGGPSQPSAMSSMVSSMSQWELFLAGGALVIVLGDLLFGILLREFYAGDILWIGAAVVLIAFAANRRAPGSVPMYASVLLLAGAVVALLGVREFIIELLFVLRNLAEVGPTGQGCALCSRPLYLVAFVVWTAGLALMVWGAWLAWRNRAA